MIMKYRFDVSIHPFRIAQCHYFSNKFTIIFINNFQGQAYQPNNYPGSMPPYAGPQGYPPNAGGPQIYHHGTMPPASSHQGPVPSGYPPPPAGQPIYVVI